MGTADEPEGWGRYLDFCRLQWERFERQEYAWPPGRYWTADRLSFTTTTRGDSLPYSWVDLRGV